MPTAIATNTGWRAKGNELLAQIRLIAKTAEDAARPLTDDEKTKAAALTDELKAVVADGKQADKDNGELDQLTADLAGGVDLSKQVPDLKAANGLGDMFLGGTKDYFDDLTGGTGIVSDRKAINSPPVDIPGGLLGRLKAYKRGGVKAPFTGGSDTSAGALVQDDQRGLVDVPGTFQREITLTDMVTAGTTGSDTVEFARITSFTNNAAPVAETLDETETPAVQGVKPKSAMTFEKVTTPVRTLAHWTPATTRALSDAGQLRTIIDNFLLYGLDEEVEDQIITGDGAGENFEGIENVSGVQAQAFDTDILTTIRKAFTKVRVNGKARVTAIAMHPNDDERLDLLKDDSGERFYFGGPVVQGATQVWGRPRIVSEAITEGTPIAGDWRQAVLWDREQSNVTATNSHEDYFVRNLVAILAEMRAAFGVIRPSAFITLDIVGP